MRSFFIAFICLLTSICFAGDSAYIFNERCMKYIDDNGGDIFEVSTVGYQLSTKQKITITRWGVTGVAKPLFSNLPDIPSTKLWIQNDYPNKLKEKHSDYTKWEARLEALTAVIAEELGINENQMKAKLKNKIKANKLKNEK